MTHASDARGRQQIVDELHELESCLMVVLQAHAPKIGFSLVGHALIEITGSVLAAIAAADPKARADFDGKLADLRAFVAATPPAGSLVS